METLKDLISSLRIQVAERASNPLTASFIIAWPFSNFRVLVVLWSDGDWRKKVEYIDKQLYPDWKLTATNCLVIPLLFAIFYVFVYPYFANKIIIMHKKRQISQRSALLELEKITPLTQDEANNMRTRHTEERIKWSEEKRLLQSEIEDLTISLQQHVSTSSSSASTQKWASPTAESEFRQKPKKDTANPQKDFVSDDKNGMWIFKNSSLSKFSPALRAAILESGLPYSVARLLRFMETQGRPLSFGQIAQKIHWSREVVMENLSQAEKLKLSKSEVLGDVHVFSPSPLGIHVLKMLGANADRWKE